MTTKSKEWIEVQSRTFCAWVNTHLRKKDKKIDDLVTGFETGENFILLMEQLTGKNMPIAPMRNPKFRIQKIQNNAIALDFLEKTENVRLVGISSDHLVDGNLRSLLGLTWTLILKYQINKGGKKKTKLKVVQAPTPTPASSSVETPQKTTTHTETPQVGQETSKAVHDQSSEAVQQSEPSVATPEVAPVVKKEEVKPAPAPKQPAKEEDDSSDVGAKKELLMWVQSQLQPYPEIKVVNFTTSWTSGLALAALVSSLKKGSIDMHTVDRSDPLALNALAIDIADKQMNIPKIVDPEDVTSKAEELSMMTYISYYRDYFTDHAEAEHAEEKKPVLDTSTCIVEEVSEEGLEGEQIRFSLRAVDTENNIYGEDVPEDLFVIVVEGPEGGEPISIKPSSLGSGVISTSFAPQTPGVYKMNILAGGKPVLSKPRVITVKSTIAPSKFVVSAPSEVQNEQEKHIEFEVSLADYKASLIPRGGQAERFKCQVKSASGRTPQFRVTEKGNGVYKVTIDPEEAGLYRAELTFDNELVAGSPFLLKASKKASPATSGIALQPVPRVYNVAKPVEIQVIARDTFGDEMSVGGDKFDVKISNAENDVDDARITDNSDGSYNLAFTPKSPGPHQVHVSLNGQELPNSPATVHVEGLTFAPMCKVSGAGISKVKSGSPAKFEIQACDKFGKFNKKGGDRFAVTITDEDGRVIPSAVLDNNDGTHSVQYLPQEKAGNYTVAVTLNGENVEGSPFTVNVEPAVCAQKSSVEGPGVEGADIASGSGVPAIFKISALDYYGKPVANDIPQDVQEELSALVDRIIAHEEKPGVQAKQSTQAEAPKTTAFDTYYYDLVVKVPENETEVQNALYETHKPEHIEKSEKANPFSIQITTAESKESVKPTVLATGPGEYTVLYTPVKPEEHTVDIKFNGEPVAQSPYVMKVSNGVDPSKCVLTGAGLTKSYIDTPARVNIKTRDNKSNPIKVGGADFDVEIVDNAGSSSVSISMVNDFGNGEYELVYIPKVPGNQNITIKCNGTPITSAPLQVFARDSAHAPDASKCELLNLKPKIKAKATTKFLVQVKNKQGQDMKSGGDDVLAILNTPSGEMKPLEIKDRNNGKYDIIITPEEVGDNIMDVKIGGESLPYCVAIRVVPAVSAEFSKISEHSLVIKTPANTTVADVDASVSATIAAEKHVYEVPQVSKVEDGKFVISFHSPEIPTKLAQPNAKTNEAPIMYDVSVQVGKKAVSGAPYLQSF